MLITAFSQAVLAAIVWVALYRLFFQVKDAWQYYKMSWGDLVRLIITYV